MNIVLDRLKLLICAILCFIAAMLCVWGVEALPDSLQIPALVPVVTLTLVWFARVCRQKGLSPWTGKPLDEPAEFHTDAAIERPES